MIRGSLEELNILSTTGMTPVPDISERPEKKLSWEAREKLGKVEKVKKMERELSLNTIKSLKKEEHQLSNERILGLLESLEVQSETSADISVPNDS